MKLTITLMNRECSQEKDVQVNSQQKVKDTLQILQEAGALWDLDFKKCSIKSLRRGLRLDAAKTYEDEHIYSGDILEIQ